MGAPCGVTAFSAPTRMLMNVYGSRETFNCMILGETCKGRSSPCLAFALPGQGVLTRHACPLLPVAFCASQAPSPRPGLLPTSFRAMFPVTPAHSAARMDPGPGGRRRNGFWPLFLPLQKAPCPPPSPPPRILPSPLPPPTGSRSLARPRT